MWGGGGGGPLEETLPFNFKDDVWIFAVLQIDFKCRELNQK